MKKRDDNEGSIFFDEKRGKYIAVITIGYNGTTGKRVRKKASAATKKEALQMLQRLKEKYAGITYFDADKITLGEWLSKWYETYSKPHLRPNSKRIYHDVIVKLQKALGGIKISKLTTYDLQRYMNCDLGDKYQTARMHRLVLKLSLQRAVREHIIKESPCEGLELPRKKPKQEFARPTAEAWQQLINFESNHYWWKMLMLTEYFTGLRRGEILGLRWSDFEYVKDASGQLSAVKISVKNNLIYFPPYSRQEESSDKSWSLADTKTASGHRTLFLPRQYGEELRAYRKKQLELRMMFPEWQNLDFLFTQLNGEPIVPNQFSSIYGLARKKIGIRTTFHMLRHDFASRMKRSGMFDMKDIQAQLGHSNINVTMNIYTHIDEEDRNAVSCWLEQDADAVVGLPAGKVIAISAAKG